MIDAAFRLLQQMDSFKKVALLALTGLSCLCLYLGYRAVENLSVYQSWNSVPHVVRTELPCNLVQVRENYFLVSISFPRPVEVQDQISTFTSSFWVQRETVEQANFTQLCRSLVKAIYSNQAETILKPYEHQ